MGSSQVAAIAFIGLNGYTAMNEIRLKYVSMSNQECRVRLVILNINDNGPLFIPATSASINSVVATMILITRTLNYVFLMLLKT